MDDTEDLLDDIKALENALVDKASIRQNEENCTLPKTSQTSYDEESNAKTYHELTSVTLDNNDDTSIDYLIELNKNLLECLYIAKDEISSLIGECNRKLELINKKLQESTSTKSRVMITAAGMPYFKDENHFPAPCNEIVKMKAANNEFPLIRLSRVPRWTPKNRNVLLRAIKEEAVADALTAANDDIGDEPVDCADAVRTFLPKNYYEMIGPLGKKEFDWLKIAAKNFHKRHSAEECRVMWNVYLHPDINKSQWTMKEDIELERIATECKLQDWDKIAVLLNTKRSGYQCYVRYNSISKMFVRLKSYTWTKEDDRKLSFLVENLKIGDFIPWGEVASCMYNRTKQQVYYRWTYSLAPHLKKGRFSKEEDEILLRAIRKYGTNFSLISAYAMPHRSSIQLTDHYRTLLSRKNPKDWELKEDMKLMELYNKIGPKWSHMAKHFKFRDRIQLRHRYTALTRAKEKGIEMHNIARSKLYSLPRFKDRLVDDSDTDEDNEHEKHDEDVDKQLMMYFSFEPDTRTSGRKQIYFDPEDLDKEVKELYKVLKELNANLNIPNDLSGVDISEIDKQILYGLRNYIQMENDRERKIIQTEEVRRKMFGINENLAAQPHFVPPLPFSGYTRKKIETHRMSVIDYQCAIEQKFTLDVPMILETPEVVIDLLGGLEQEAQFQKFSKSLSMKCLKSNDKDISSTKSISSVRKLHVISPSALRKYPGDRMSEKLYSFYISQQDAGISGNEINVFQENMRKKNLVLRKIDQMTIVLPKDGENIVSKCEKNERTSESSNMNIIKPSRPTLSIFEKFLFLKDRYKRKDKRPGNIPPLVLQSCEKAHRLLKERLWSILKYPLYLNYTDISEISKYMGNLQVFNNNKRILQRDCNKQNKRARKDEGKEVQIETEN